MKNAYHAISNIFYHFSRENRTKLAIAPRAVNARVAHLGWPGFGRQTRDVGERIEGSGRVAQSP